MCLCISGIEETKKRLAIMEADILFSMHGGQMVFVERDNSNPFKNRYKVKVLNNNCVQHALRSYFFGTYKNIVYYLPNP
ncbi:hypothetical protein A374_11575 [Fictibacillus macauensis ZFHKF-1]|uniref:Uncharacterized protein n=1 Tax=Fictibacillus macauensis ZFHKF-1 TaxID=1196324 RepID=I8J0V0_9BACL|nr:hypothetical protein A374_11575 [Fictibacillus macauensis ZFHKF-1]